MQIFQEKAADHNQFNGLALVRPSDNPDILDESMGIESFLFGEVDRHGGMTFGICRSQPRLEPLAVANTSTPATHSFSDMRVSSSSAGANNTLPSRSRTSQARHLRIAAMAVYHQSLAATICSSLIPLLPSRPATPVPFGSALSQRSPHLPESIHLSHHSPEPQHQLPAPVAVALHLLLHQLRGLRRSKRRCW